MDIEQIRSQAQGENTPSKILAELANNKDLLTRQYVASNPNTPIEILQKLASEFPEEIMANPILDLLILESPQSITAIKMAIAKSPHTSRRMLDDLKSSKDKLVREAIAKNPHTSKNTLHYLWNNEDAYVLLHIIENPNTSKRTIRPIAKAGNNNTPPEALARLASDSYNNGSIIRRIIARNPITPKKTLEYLKNDEWHVRLGVASNPNTPLDTLSELADSSDVNIAYEAKRNLERNNQTIQQASNLNTSPEILTRLAQSKYEIVRRYVASNPNTPTKILDYLKNSTKKVRIAIAENPHTPEKTLDYLKGDCETEVRIAVTQSPQTSEKILNYLMNDKRTSVRISIAINPNTSDSTLQKIANSLTEYSYDVMVDFVSKMRQAQNENTPPKILAQLANKDESIPIRKAVARNPNTSKKTLDYLKKDEWHVLTEVAKNPHTSINALKSLLASPFKDIAHKAIWNLKTKIDRVAFLDEMMENNLLNRIEERLRED